MFFTSHLLLTFLFLPSILSHSYPIPFMSPCSFPLSFLSLLYVATILVSVTQNLLLQENNIDKYHPRCVRRYFNVCPEVRVPCKHNQPTKQTNKQKTNMHARSLVTIENQLHGDEAFYDVTMNTGVLYNELEGSGCVQIQVLSQNVPIRT
jgi:hypothetical protein